MNGRSIEVGQVRCRILRTSVLCFLVRFFDAKRFWKWILQSQFSGVWKSVNSIVKMCSKSLERARLGSENCHGLIAKIKKNYKSFSFFLTLQKLGETLFKFFVLSRSGLDKKCALVLFWNFLISESSFLELGQTASPPHPPYSANTLDTCCLCGEAFSNDDPPREHIGTSSIAGEYSKNIFEKLNFASRGIPL